MMFGSGGGGGWSILGPPAAEIVGKERPPPGRPLPLEFPEHVPPRTSHSLSRRRMISFRSSLLRLRKPSDVCDGLLVHLNIHLEKDVPLADLVPQSSFGERPFLFDSDLEAMLAELDIENEDAYREVMRQPPLEGRKKPRLAYSRNFFAGLEDMRRYYDSSKDHYYTVKLDEHEEEEWRRKWVKGAKDDTDGDAKMTDNDAEPKCSTPGPSSSSNTSDSTADVDTDVPATLSPSDPILSNGLWKEVYKGLRLGNATALPPPTRASTVRNLLKMVTHKFNCRDYDAHPKERLKMADLVLPQGIGPWGIGMYTFAIVKVPAEMKLARGRYVEGPVVGVSVRHEAVFKKKKPTPKKKDSEPELVEAWDTPDRHGSAFDFSREVAGMLVLALQRNREGKGTRDEVHEAESEDWWWTKAKRWGGGPTKWGQLAWEVYEDEDPCWSPEERELQLAKRREAEEEMERFAKVGDHGKDVDAEDLIAGAQEKEKSTEEGRSERGPPKKRNRTDIPDRPKRVAESGDRDSSSENSKTNGRAKGSNGKKRIDSEGEFHDGRRVMYVAPSRRKFYKEWQSIRPNTSTWDEKMIHRRIGRSSPTDTGEGGGDGEWDEVFQVTSVNHHVAIMKMRISKRYLRWLETGEAKKREEGGEEDILRIWRSEWFDMFDREARKAWMVGMWRVMCWVCREEVPKAEWERWEGLKEEREEKK